MTSLVKRAKHYREMNHFMKLGWMFFAGIGARVSSGSVGE